MALMPLSQCVAWYFVMDIRGISRNAAAYTTLEQAHSPLLYNLYQVVCRIASFYCLWALYNRYIGGAVQELGQFSMGATALATYCQNWTASMITSLLVLLNFLLPSYFILWKWDAATLAETVKQDSSALGMVWAYIFKVYFVSQILLWCTILSKLYRNK